MSEWISVKNRIPLGGIDVKEQVDDVLIIFKRKCIECGNFKKIQHYGIGYCFGNGEWHLTELLSGDYFPSGYEDSIKVTHWMPLPAAPEQEKE